MKIFRCCLYLITFTLVGCSNTKQITDAIPDHETFVIQSKIVNEARTINIWLPEQYDINLDSLPVLYMLDGGIKEDFPHIANTLSELIKANKIPPYILVGIQNTKRRRDLTGPTNVEKDKEIADEVGESAIFRAFINDELIPKINLKYRTTNRKGIIGESLAGLFVMETFLIQPSMFDFYIAFDPSLWWNNHNYELNAANYLKNLPPKTTKLWFATSSAEGMSDSGNNLANAFQKVSNTQLMWKYSPESKEEHHTIFRATKEKAIIWTLN